ncbi:MAG: amidase family protein [Gemmataceae bacterium]
MIERHRMVMAVEAAAYHRDRLARHPDDYPPNIRALLEEGIATPAPEYALTKEHQRHLTAEMPRAFAGCDALVCPATPTAAPDATTTGSPAFNSPWSYTGLPVVSVPVRLDPAGLPLGVQLVGLPLGEGGLFRVAAWVESAIGPGIGEPPLVRS